MSVHGPAWDRDEAFRQSVIRKALLLGFSATEDKSYYYRPVDCNSEPVWSFMFEGHNRTGYKSLYSAAYDYLRLMEVPLQVIGDYRG